MKLTAKMKNNALMNIEDLIISLHNITKKHCTYGGKLDSMNIEENANAIRVIADIGLAEIISDNKIRVIAKTKEKYNDSTREKMQGRNNKMVQKE